ncbi:MAG: PEGA domain-containing protein, partial [Myxococcales bacterium]|nr:PEGA domain-containing protein [Myxococcales bacterium]
PVPAIASATDGLAAGSSDADELSPDEDGEALAGGPPVVGHGPCRFTVATTPAGSIVRLDDQAMGPSPITIESTCEKHKVDVTHARYQSATRWVTLAADKPQELGINLSRPTHAVTVTSSPSGAELSIEGRRAGTTPTVIQMMGFASVRLRFTKPGYQSVTKKVYSKTAQDRVFVKLSK